MTSETPLLTICKEYVEDTPQEKNEISAYKKALRITFDKYLVDVELVVLHWNAHSSLYFETLNKHGCCC